MTMMTSLIMITITIEVNKAVVMTLTMMTSLIMIEYLSECLILMLLQILGDRGGGDGRSGGRSGPTRPTMRGEWHG